MVDLATASQEDVAMGIGSAGEGTGGTAKHKGVNKELGLLSSQQDLEDFKGWLVRNDYISWGCQNSEGEMGRASNVLDEIKRFCRAARQHDKRALIYYTGHGEVGTGNWCFPNGGRISLHDVVAACTPLPRNGLKLISDACFSGKWALAAQLHGYDLTVESAAGPDKSAIDRVYAKAQFSGGTDTDSYLDRLSRSDLGAIKYSRHKIHYLNDATDFDLCIKRNYFLPETRTITAQAFSSDSAFLIMTRMPDWKQTQSMGSWDYVKKAIWKWRAKQYHLTSLQYGGMKNVWSAVMTQGAGVRSETFKWKTRLEDGGHICTDTDKGWIVDVSFGDPGWMFVCAGTKEITSQAWHWSTHYNSIHDFIQKRGAAGYTISSIAKGDKGQKVFIVVMSKVSVFGHQSSLWLNQHEHKAKIAKYWDSGHRITAVADDFDNDQDKRYWVVMTKVTGSKLYPCSGNMQHWMSHLRV